MRLTELPFLFFFIGYQKIQSISEGGEPDKPLLPDHTAQSPRRDTSPAFAQNRHMKKSTNPPNLA
jgi:hypothetical protein